MEAAAAALSILLGLAAIVLAFQAPAIIRALAHLQDARSRARARLMDAETRQLWGPQGPDHQDHQP